MPGFHAGKDSHMPDYPRQIVIGEPLWDFMRHCEIYCSGACCGTGAFEVHPALLLRKVIDTNLAGLDGAKLFREARRQITELRQRVSSEETQSVNGETPFWRNASEPLAEYWLPAGEVRQWLENWEAAFAEASRFGGLDKG